MSGFKGAIRVGGIVIMKRTCDGDGWWECSNIITNDERLCAECLNDDDGGVP